MNTALLGDIPFEVIPLAGFEGKFGFDFAEHARIGEKPRLQSVGEKLAEYTINLKFHQSFCDPAGEYEKIKAAATLKLALPLLLGDSEYLGEFVITDYSISYQQFATIAGAQVALVIEVSLNIKECPSDEDKSPLGKAVKRKGFIPASLSKVDDLAKPKMAITTALQAVQHAREVISFARKTVKSVQLVKNMLQSPSSALKQIGKLAPYLSQALTSAEKLGVDTAGISAIVQAAIPVGEMAQKVGDETRLMISAAQGVTADNLAARLGLLEGGAISIDKAILQSRKGLSELTALVVTRAPLLKAN